MVFKIQCVAPLKHAEPLPNKTLLTLMMVTRHGARSPVDAWALPNETGTWICDKNEISGAQTKDEDRVYAPRLSAEAVPHWRTYHQILDQTKFPPSCGSSELLITGMQQHKELGEYYRKLLIDQMHFLSPNFNPREIYLRASKSDRCLRSLMSFMSGLYPEDYSSNNEVFQVVTGAPPLEPLNPDPYGYKDIQNAYDKFIHSEEYAKRRNYSMPIVQPLFDYLHLTPTWDMFTWLGDWLYSFHCSDQAIPAIVTDEMFEVAMNDTVYYSGGLFAAYPNECSGAIWRLLIEHLDKILSGETSYKFNLFSAHDSTIEAILTKLGYFFTTSIPPYRSHLVFEIYDDNTLRLVYNGDVLPINGKEIISINNFKMLVVDTFKYCLN